MLSMVWRAGDTGGIKQSLQLQQEEDPSDNNSTAAATGGVHARVRTHTPLHIWLPLLENILYVEVTETK